MNDQIIPSQTSIPFTSILFDKTFEKSVGKEADFFHDLNLDQLMEGISSLKKSYEISSFFYRPLEDISSIAYRQSVMRDLEDKDLRRIIDAFCTSILKVHALLEKSEKGSYPYEKARYFLNSSNLYGDALQELKSQLSDQPCPSAGLQGFRKYVEEYVASPYFSELTQTAKEILAELDSVRYSLFLKENSVTVQIYKDEKDYTPIIEKTFEKFKDESVLPEITNRFEWETMNHIEAQILDRVALLFPEIFQRLETFWSTHKHYWDETILRFETEVQFYLAYLDFIAPLKAAGLIFCYPDVQRQKDIRVRDSFDIALAQTLARTKATVVTNDFSLENNERILVITGPNNGGKTTFARMFGQLHYLARLGLPVPGSEAKLFLYDHLFTHFEKEEDPSKSMGKLKEELVRIHEILECSSQNSLIILNEIFSSATIHDAIFLGKSILQKIAERDILAVCVTFVDELSTSEVKTVSLVATIDPLDPAIRTFKVERQPANGLAYAWAIAEKYHVTYDWLIKRIKT